MLRARAAALRADALRRSFSDDGLRKRLAVKTISPDKLIYGSRKLLEHNVHIQPHVVTAVQSARRSEIAGVVTQAVMSGTLGARHLKDVLQNFRRLRRLDRSEAVVRAYLVAQQQQQDATTKRGPGRKLEAQRGLNAHHYAILMSHAREAGQWRRAVHFWSEMQQRCVPATPIAYASYIAALSAGGQWEVALMTYDVLLEERRAPTNGTVCVLMGMCRVLAQEQGGREAAEAVLRRPASRNPRTPRLGAGSQPQSQEPQQQPLQSQETAVPPQERPLHPNHDRWAMALRVFSSAIANGLTRPEYPVYRTLLYSLLDATRWLTSSWRYALAALQAAPRTIERNAGLVNAAMRTCIAADRWEHALRLYSAMRSTGIAPNGESLVVAMSVFQAADGHGASAFAAQHGNGKISASGAAARRRAPRWFLLRVLEEHRFLQLPVPASLYRTVLSRLFRGNDTDGAVAFFDAAVQRQSLNPGDATNDLHALYLGMLDALLHHPFPKQAVDVVRHCRIALDSVVSLASLGVGTVGLGSPHWVVEGRVAVVSAAVLAGFGALSLAHHYDHVIVPYSEIRGFAQHLVELKPETEKRSGTDDAAHVAATVEQARRDAKAARLRSAMKHLGSAVRVVPLAHQLEAHAHLSEASGRAADAEDVALVHRVSDEESRRRQHAANAIRIRSDANASFPSPMDGAGTTTSQGSTSSAPATLVSTSQNTADGAGGDVRSEFVFLDSTHQHVAVVLMLQRLNPGAAIHFVSTRVPSLHLARQRGCIAVEYSPNLEHVTPRVSGAAEAATVRAAESGDVSESGWGADEQPRVARGERTAAAASLLPA